MATVPPFVTGGGGVVGRNAPVGKESMSHSTTLMIVLGFATVLTLVIIAVSMFNIMWGAPKKEENNGSPDDDTMKKETTYNNQKRDRVNLIVSIVLLFTICSGLYVARGA